MFSQSKFQIIRIVVILIALAAILFKFTTGISAMNKIQDDGEVLLLKLRPVDPRALMLGDYMALAYDNSAFPETNFGIEPQGALVLKMDENKVGSFGRLDTGAPLREGEIRVKYALKKGKADFGSARYYFQEGTAQAYEPAKYGVFKVSPTGHMILESLADEDFKVIQPKEVVTKP